MFTFSRRKRYVVRKYVVPKTLKVTKTTKTIDKDYDM